ncbi:MAG: hypothetical protein Q7J05_01990 [Paludibacter sp.]|nr:hypothetical protein [Paludibacter sp.]
MKKVILFFAVAAIFAACAPKAAEATEEVVDTVTVEEVVEVPVDTVAVVVPAAE